MHKKLELILIGLLLSFSASYASSNNIKAPSSRLEFSKIQPGLSSMTTKKRRTNPDENYTNYALSFSHGSQLFAVLETSATSKIAPSTDIDVYNPYPPSSTRVTLWDTHTAALKYQLPFFEVKDGANMSHIEMKFSPKDSMLLVSGVVGEPLPTWEFTESNTVNFSCNPQMSSEIIQVDESNKSYVMTTVDGFYSLCFPHNSKGGIYYRYDKELFGSGELGPATWWGENLKILHNNKLLILYNIRHKIKPPHQPKGKPDANTSQWVEPWNMNYISDAEHMVSLVDRQQKRFFLVESFNDKITISQWNYATRKWLNKQSFPGVKVDKNLYGWSDDNSLANNAYLSDQHLLLRSGEQYTLFKRHDHHLDLLWTKPLPGSPGQQPFSLDGQHLIFHHTPPVILINTSDGRIQQPSSSDSHPEPHRILVDPQAEYFVESFSGKEGCPPNKKSRLYSLPSNKKVADIDGAVLAMSPDGNVLAVCRDKALFLLRNQMQ